MVAKHEGDDFHPKRETFFLERKKKLDFQLGNFQTPHFFLSKNLSIIIGAHLFFLTFPIC
jgi:hypothetical protein